jgi:outer membrane protein W
MKILAAVALAFFLSAPAGAQGLSFRPYGMFAQQSFDAHETFSAVFDSSSGSFFGGGLNITDDDRFYFDIGASHFKKTGQRAFVNAGQTFKTGIPLTATIIPLEFSGGYRFNKGKRIRPYAGAGVGSYHYEETSGFSEDGEDVDARHAGVIFEGGAEFRINQWMGAAADVHYTYVPGILGTAGISKDEGETSLGGFQFRIRFLVGK